jgi:hypothetical protein
MQTLNITRLHPNHKTHLSLGDSRDNLLAVLVVADTRGGSTVATAHARSDTVNHKKKRVHVSRYIHNKRTRVIYHDARNNKGVRECIQLLEYSQGSSEAHTPKRSCHTPGTDNVPDNLAVNGARDAVLQLQVHLGDGVLGEDGGIRDVTY